MSDRGSAVRRNASLLAVLAVVVVAVLLLGRGDEGEVTPGPGAPSSPGPVAVPTDEAFCDGYRALAAAQGSYAAGAAGGADSLREAARSLIDLGVPDTMSTLARTGFHVEMSGVFQSVGEDLPLSAVAGALPDKGTGTSLSGTVGAFGEWLVEYCPPTG